MPKKIDYISVISESASELAFMAKSQKNRRNADHIRFLWYLKTGQATSQGSAGELINLKLRQSQNLWKQYQKEGISGLMINDTPKNWGKLSSTQISQLLSYLDGDQVKTQKEMQAFIQSEMGIEYTQAGIHYLFKRLRVKLKTGRPSNIRKDEAGAIDFKKSS